MKSLFTIKNDEQYAEVLELLQLAIERDCIKEKEYVRKKEKETVQTLGPEVFAAFMKNLEIREVVYTQLIKDIERHRKAGSRLTLEEFYRQFVISFTAATINEDAYSTIFLSRIKDSDDRRKPRQQLEPAEPPVNLVTMYQKAGLEEKMLIDIRLKTIGWIIKVAFDSFYSGAVGREEAEKGETKKYSQFCNWVNEHIYKHFCGEGRRAR